MEINSNTFSLSFFISLFLTFNFNILHILNIYIFSFYYIIEAPDLRSILLEPPLYFSLSPFGESSIGNIFQKLANELVWDPEYGEMQIDCIEIMKLQRKNLEEQKQNNGNQISKLFDETTIEKSMRAIVTRQHTLWEESQYKSKFPEESPNIIPTTPPLIVISNNTTTRRAIIDRSESALVQEFTSQSHRKDPLKQQKSKSYNRGVSQLSSFHSINFDEDNGDIDNYNNDTTEKNDDIKPEDNIIPYKKRDNVDVAYIDKENERISLQVQEQVFINTYIHAYIHIYIFHILYSSLIYFILYFLFYQQF